MHKLGKLRPKLMPQGKGKLSFGLAGFTVYNVCRVHMLVLDAHAGGEGGTHVAAHIVVNT